MNNAVRVVREQVGLKLRPAARAAGIDPATLSNIETGKQKLTDEIARKLARVFTCSVGMLFEDPELIEKAMLKQRKAPVLSDTQLLSWRDNETYRPAEDQDYRNIPLEKGSRSVFARIIQDAANDPELKVGEEVVFDGKRAPAFGDMVIAQAAAGKTYIGRYRPSEDGDAATIIPMNPTRLYPEMETKTAKLIVRGVRCARVTYY